ELLTLRGPGTLVSVAWSPDGKRLATAGGDRTARVWDAATAQNLFTLFGHSQLVNTVAWSPDGRRLATGSWDQTAKVWDAATGNELATLSGHSKMVICVAWSPDGKRLATASFDNTLLIFEMDLDRLMALARSRVTRNLTPDECQKYLHVDKCPPSLSRLRTDYRPESVY